MKKPSPKQELNFPFLAAFIGIITAIALTCVLLALVWSDISQKINDIHVIYTVKENSVPIPTPETPLCPSNKMTCTPNKECHCATEDPNACYHWKTDCGEGYCDETCHMQPEPQ